MPFPELIGPGKFAAGWLTYTDHFGNDNLRNTRIVISIVVGDGLATTTIVDTGALWCIIGPEEATAIDDKYLEPVREDRIVVRGSSYHGTVFHIPITLYTEHIGTNITIEASVFVPTLPPNVEWKHPNFIGLDGFLHRLRFAIDPADNKFYFGLIED